MIYLFAASATPVSRRGRKTIFVISPASVPAKRRKSSETRPDDKALPDFDPDSYTPGTAPDIVKKGQEEYMVIVSGVQDTGLCGKYWSDVSPSSSRRRRSDKVSPAVSENGQTTRKCKKL